MLLFWWKVFGVVFRLVAFESRSALNACKKERRQESALGGERGACEWATAAVGAAPRSGCSHRVLAERGVTMVLFRDHPEDHAHGQVPSAFAIDLDCDLAKEGLDTYSSVSKRA